MLNHHHDDDLDIMATTTVVFHRRVNRYLVVTLVESYPRRKTPAHHDEDFSIRGQIVLRGVLDLFVVKDSEKRA